MGSRGYGISQQDMVRAPMSSQAVDFSGQITAKISATCTCDSAGGVQIGLRVCPKREAAQVSTDAVQWPSLSAAQLARQCLTG